MACQRATVPTKWALSMQTRHRGSIHHVIEGLNVWWRRDEVTYASCCPHVPCLSLALRYFHDLSTCLENSQICDISTWNQTISLLVSVWRSNEHRHALGSKYKTTSCRFHQLIGRRGCGVGMNGTRAFRSHTEKKISCCPRGCHWFLVRFYPWSRFTVQLGAWNYTARGNTKDITPLWGHVQKKWYIVAVMSLACRCASTLSSTDPMDFVSAWSTCSK